MNKRYIMFFFFFFFNFLYCADAEQEKKEYDRGAHRKKMKHQADQFKKEGPKHPPTQEQFNARLAVLKARMDECKKFRTSPSSLSPEEELRRAMRDGDTGTVKRILAQGGHLYLVPDAAGYSAFAYLLQMRPLVSNEKQERIRELEEWEHEKFAQEKIEGNVLAYKELVPLFLIAAAQVGDHNVISTLRVLDKDTKFFPPELWQTVQTTLESSQEAQKRKMF